MSLRKRDLVMSAALVVSLLACGSDAARNSRPQTVDLTKFISTDVTTTTPDKPTTNCGSITSDGDCNGDVYSYCSSGKLITRDCTASSLSCKIDNAGVASCVDTAASGCGSIPAQGICSGTVLMYCDLGQVTSYDCWDYGYDCIEDFSGANCY